MNRLGVSRLNTRLLRVTKRPIIQKPINTIKATASSGRKVIVSLTIWRLFAITGSSRRSTRCSTFRRLSTETTPSTRFAMSSALALAAGSRAVPSSVTTPSCTVMCTSPRPSTSLYSEARRLRILASGLRSGIGASLDAGALALEVGSGSAWANPAPVGTCTTIKASSIFASAVVRLVVGISWLAQISDLIWAYASTANSPVPPMMLPTSEGSR